MNKERNHAVLTQKVEKITSHDDIWIKRGEPDIEYQRQAQITWWSIIGGLAVGALLTQFPLVIENLNKNHWQLVLFYIATIIFIVLNWINVSWGSLVLKVRLHVARSFVTFLTGFSLALVALLVVNPPLWLASVAIWILCGIIQNYVEYRLGVTEKSIWSKKNSFLKAIWIYLLFMIISIGGAVCLVLYPSQILEIIFAGISIGGGIYSLVSQHHVMEEERKKGLIP